MTADVSMTPDRVAEYEALTSSTVSEIPEVPEVTYGGGGAHPLDEIRAWLARFIVPLHDRDLDLLTLWAVHTHLLDVVGTTPRLIITSPLPESGKTTCLEHLNRIAFAPIQIGSLSSPAMVTRLLAAGPRTLLIDEVDRNLNPDRDGVADLLAVLNSGYKKGATRPILVPASGSGWRVEELPTFAPVVMAGISPNLPDDTQSRTVTVVLLPDSAGAAEDSDWEEIEDEAQALAKRVADWATFAQLDLPKPELPDGVRGRAKERWRPLWRVANKAGGDWPARCRALIAHESDELSSDREEGLMRQHPAIALLRDVAEEWPKGLDTWPTESIRSALVNRDPERWGPNGPYPKGLTVQRIGRYLGRSFRVRTLKASDGTSAGYSAVEVAGVCRRLGIPTPFLETSGTSGTSETPAGRCAHGVEAGHLPDTFLKGKIRCTECRAAAS